MILASEVRLVPVGVRWLQRCQRLNVVSRGTSMILASEVRLVPVGVRWLQRCQRFWSYTIENEYIIDLQKLEKKVNMDKN
jgi:hypothetical protein